MGGRVGAVSQEESIEDEDKDRGTETAVGFGGRWPMAVQDQGRAADGRRQG